MSQIFLLIQSLNPYGKVCLWALMIAIDVSAAICQLPIRKLYSFGKMTNVASIGRHFLSSNIGASG